MSEETTTSKAVREHLALLPQRLIVGSYPIRIRITKRSDIGQNVRAWGMFDPLSQELVLADYYPSLSFLCSTFLHELNHVIWWAQGLGSVVDLQVNLQEMEERIVDLYGNGQTQVFRDNPWLAAWIDGCFRYDRPTATKRPAKAPRTATQPRQPSKGRVAAKAKKPATRRS